MEQTFFEGFTVDNISQRIIEVDNKGGNISSDGGLILFSSLDNRLKITEEIAECITDERQEGKTLHGMRDSTRLPNFWGQKQCFFDYLDSLSRRRGSIFSLKTHVDNII